ncbi:mechanosensitive ion channel family protein [Marixanthomonas spongiae]|uniref:Mechanosensitive ion channel family protein n=1 Tax=Marixanthomonas spongiae TaxID=2174845 RepID=A0A2U0HUT4_9FLAO|nr:mechanosensitive ion channel family protein [Marixanthomonas spongiae]PVW12632.1 mechanosensitive ion channel family protein [Marixanthomonas spongiae]
MEEFLTEYKTEIIWVIGVIVTVVMLHLLTNVLYTWLLKKERRRFPEAGAQPVKLVKRILNALWLVLGLIALSFIFVDEEDYGVLEDNFKIVLYVGAVAVVTIVSATSANLWFKRSIQKKIQNLDDPTSYKFLRYVAVFGIYFTGILFALLAFPSLKGVAQTALGGAGVIALVIGVASQEALANLVGGLFIISFKPFKVGDLIKVTDTMVGTVTDITLRHTIIRNFENKMIVIPNSIINKEKLINYDLGEQKCCERIEINISFDSDVDLAKKIMKEECEKHPLLLDNRTQQEVAAGAPLVKTALLSINDYSVTVRAWTWGKTFSDCFQLRIDVLDSIKRRFDAEGIELATPYRTVVMKNREENQPAKTQTDA